MALDKRRNVVYISNDKADYYLSSAFYQNHDEVISESPVDLMKIVLKKRRQTDRILVHVAHAILQKSKLQMLEIIYGVSKVMRPMSFQAAYMDTDSWYLLLTKNSLDELVREGCEDAWKILKSKYFVTDHNCVVQCRTPGLLKVSPVYEYETYL